MKFDKPTSVTIYINELVNAKKYYKELDFDYEINIEDNTDISINGFGIINIKKSNNINIVGLDKELISIRKSIFGGFHE